MWHEKNFQHYCNFDVSNIISILHQESDWFKDTHRQNTYGVHAETQSITLIDAPNTSQWRQSDWAGENLHWWRMRGPYYDACQHIIEDLEKRHNGSAFKSFLTRLPAGAKVTGHTDRSPIYHLSRRHHIPIITNNDVKFIIDGEVLNMKVGECWEISNQKFHEVSNNGTDDRVHLIIDIFPNDRKDNCGPECLSCNRVRDRFYDIFYEDRY
jgi:hypothetical protein